ncbi:hypothetical protein PAL_GLEAN10023447 [Pteropus alecto]|uniref:Uncharacterized protein n=1 Tax=Pteropus alecto TaxID=9402 RepID=L5K1G8_PTEAL|nr:hypothetical protein PAL_GLEAN10023447 [Pteropus alecto]
MLGLVVSPALYIWQQRRKELRLPTKSAACRREAGPRGREPHNIRASALERRSTAAGCYGDGLLQPLERILGFIREDCSLHYADWFIHIDLADSSPSLCCFNWV